MHRRSMLAPATISSQKLTQVYSLYEWEDVQDSDNNEKCQSTKQWQHNGKINEGQGMYGIVTFYLFFQLFPVSSQKV